jgi:hypothetical protein
MEFEATNDFINAIDTIEIILLILIVIDAIVKITNHVMILRSNISHHLNNEDQIYFDEPLTFDPFKNSGSILIKTEYIVMDAVCVIAIIVMYLT